MVTARSEIRTSIGRSATATASTWTARHTQTVEGFFGSSKNAIRGVYHGVSTQWLQGYLNEYAWRYERRGDRNTMFRDLIETAAERTV